MTPELRLRIGDDKCLAQRKIVQASALESAHKRGGNPHSLQHHMRFVLAEARAPFEM